MYVIDAEKLSKLHLQFFEPFHSQTQRETNVTLCLIGWITTQTYRSELCSWAWRPNSNTSHRCY